MRNDSIVYPSDEEPNNLSDTEDTAPESSRKPSRVTQKELLVNNANKCDTCHARHATPRRSLPGLEVPSV